MKKKELLEKIEKLVGKRDELLKKQKEIKDDNLFMFFEPNTSEIAPEGMTLLRKYLKPEDIPQHFDSQVDIFSSTEDIIAVFGGNRGGKSAAGVIDSIIVITDEIPAGLKGIFPEEKLMPEKPVFVRVVGVDDKQLRNTIIPAYRKWVPKQHLLKNTWEESWSATDMSLHFYRNGNKQKYLGMVEFMTNMMEVKKFQGPERHKILYDEEPRQDIYKENLQRLATSPYGVNVRFYMTPTEGMTWMTNFFETKNERLDRFFLVSITNPHVKIKTLDNILSDPTYSYDEIKMRLTGAIISLGGLIYGSLFSRLHVIEPFKLNQDDYIIYRGLDPHSTKPSVCVELAVNRANEMIVVGTYSRACDTQEIKDDLAERVRERGYRLGWSKCDKSANWTNVLAGGLNMYKQLSEGKNHIPALGLSEKFTGSILAGVDAIKKALKINPITKRPRLFIWDTEENQTLITALRTIERQRHTNEDAKGTRDAILEGKHDTHAALRYILQHIVEFIPRYDDVPDYEAVDEDTAY